MQTVAITGGTGLVGRALTRLLVQKGYRVIIFSRNPSQQKTNLNHVTFAAWNVKAQTIDVGALLQADHIIHLAGAGVVDKKWTREYKQEIVDSRTQSSQLLVKTLQQNPHHVQSIVSSSAIGWYGADAVPARPFVETDPPDDHFLGETCRLWENSIQPAEALGIRVVKLRTGIVLSNEGGALAEFKKPLRVGVAGILGDGQQMVSWIHMNDLCRMYLDAMKNQQYKGAYNAVAPFPVNNKTLTLTLAKALNGKWFIPLPVPTFVLKIMMGERSIEVLKSTTVSAAAIQQAGFQFSFATITAALEDLCKK